MGAALPLSDTPINKNPPSGTSVSEGFVYFALSAEYLFEERYEGSFFQKSAIFLFFKSS